MNEFLRMAERMRKQLEAANPPWMRQMIERQNEMDRILKTYTDQQRQLGDRLREASRMSYSLSQLPPLDFIQDGNEDDSAGSGNPKRRKPGFLPWD